MPNKKKHAKPIYIVATVMAVLALLALCITRFCIFPVLGGGNSATSLSADNDGTLVKISIDQIVGFYGEELDESGETTAIYAAVPMGSGYATVILTPRYFDTAHAVYDSTFDVLDSVVESAEYYFEVVGSVNSISSTAKELYSAWLSKNFEWLQFAGLPTAENPMDLINPYVIKADYAGGFSIMTVYIISGIAALLILLSIVLFTVGALRKDEAEEVDAASDHLSKAISELIDANMPEDSSGASLPESGKSIIGDKAPVPQEEVISNYDAVNLSENADKSGGNEGADV